MPRKTSFYVDDACEGIVAARDGAPQAVRRLGRRSLLFREMLRRYDAICRSELPLLDEREWFVVLDAGSDWASEPVSASTRLGHLFAAAHAARAEALIRKLMTLSVSGSTALIDFVERYWAARARGEAPPALPSSAEASAGAAH